MRVVLLSQAADEFEDAVAYYEGKQVGLGRKFRNAVDHHICWIATHADTPRLRPAGYRRVNLRVFPHYIAYPQLDDTVWVLAIAHGHREPEYWVNRKRAISQRTEPPNHDASPSVP